MKSSSAVLIIAAGILLLWIVTSDRLKNVRASWNALLGTASAPSGSSSAAAVAGTATPSTTSAGLPGLPSTSPLDQYAIPEGTLTVPSATDLGSFGLPTIDELTYPAPNIGQDVAP